jgi:hypothetical protein
MSRRIEDDEPLLPPWLMSAVLMLGPIAGVAVLYYLLRVVFRVPGAVSMWTAIVLAVAVAVYLGGKFYKPYRVNKEGRCVASGARQRLACRHYMPGARLGGGCGRQREDGRCRRMVS